MLNDRRSAVAVLLLVVALVASACSDSSSSDEGTGGAEGLTPAPGGELVLALDADTTGFNPIVDRFAIHGHFVASAIFDPLARIDETGELVPHLASSIEPNEDATVWTITVPEGVTFHDGSVMTAEVVRESLQVRKDNPLTGGVQLGAVDEIVTVDEATVEVRMNQPWAVFDHMLAQQVGYVVSPSMLEAYPDTSEPVGTGPFVFVEHVPDSHVVLERNPDYWQEGKPYLERLEFRVMIDSAGQEAALRAGDIDGLFTISPSLIGDLRDDEYLVVDDASADENLVVLNADVPPLDDIRIRRALALATDRQLINGTLYDGALPDATGPFSRGEPWYEPDTGYPALDPEEAMRLVEEHVAETGEPVSLTLTQIHSPDGRSLGQLLTEMWGAVGIDLEVEELEQSQFISELVNGDLQLANFQNFGYSDPDFMYLFLHSSNAAAPGEGISINFSHTRSEALDAALDLGRESLDHETRVGAYQDMVQAMNEELAYLWLSHRLAGIVAEPDVGGLETAEAVGFGRVDEKTWIADLWVHEGD